MRRSAHEIIHDAITRCGTWKVAFILDQNDSTLVGFYAGTVRSRAPVFALVNGPQL